MWFEDIYKKQKEQQQINYKKYVKSLLNSTFPHLKYEDMHRLVFDENYMLVRMKDSQEMKDSSKYYLTNDGSEYYEGGDGKYYIFCFLEGEKKWIEYQYINKPIADKSIITNSNKP